MSTEKPRPSLARPLAIGGAISLVVLVLALLHPFKPSAKASSGPVAAGDASRGKPIFAAKCAGCHGTAGVGGGIGPTLAGASLTAAVVSAKIAAGGGAMPPGLVSGADRDDVVAYVVSLGKGAIAAPAATATATATATTPTEAAAPTTAATEPPPAPAPAILDAARKLPQRLAAGAGQVRVLSQHVGFLDQAFRVRFLPNVRFHGEHLVNITLGEPIRDLDGDGKANNPGDGVGLVGRDDTGYVGSARAAFDQIASGAGVPEDVAAQARQGSAAAAALLGQFAAFARQATACARASTVASVVPAHERVDALRADIVRAYAALRTDADAVAGALAG